MADNNTTQGTAWWIKPSSDSIDYVKGLPVHFFTDANNIETKGDKLKGTGYFKANNSKRRDSRRDLSYY